jgi:seryl-tRNA synthetase
MEYTGNIYAKIGGKYIKIGHSDDFDKIDEKLKQVQASVVEFEEKVNELNQTIIAKQQREIRLENILAPHQELTQWIEEEIEPVTFEVSHDFLENLLNKVNKINH